MKKGRHRRYEEARALKRGPDLDIEALFTDLEGEPVSVTAAMDSAADTDIENDVDPSERLDDPGYPDDDRYDEA